MTVLVGRPLRERNNVYIGSELGTSDGLLVAWFAYCEEGKHGDLTL